MSPNADVIDINSARSQRVLMLSWEYPPVLVGGLGRHVHALSVALATAGHEVTVVTRHADGAPLEEHVDGVRVIRAAEDPVTFPLATGSLLAWTMAFNHTLTRAALRAADTGDYDVIHAHDWLVAHTAITLAEHLHLPLVTTIHATEAGRHQGWLPAEMNRTIHGVEHWLSNASTRLIACSGYMREQVSTLFEVAPGQIEVVPNGVDDRAWRARPRAVASARARFAGDGPLIGYAGRLVYEKGVQHLVDAVPQLRDRHPGLRVLIAGDGPYRGELEERIGQLGLGNTVRFAGFLDNTQLPAVLGATDATVVPSLYEPFGMVALEAAAAGAPLAVARTGGLAEIVEPGVTGVTFPHSDPSALAGAVGELLGDEVFARRVARQARSMVGRRYGWATIAARTAETYATARRDHAPTRTRRATTDIPAPRTPIAIPDGNLLASAAC
ncbi:glycosyltransferase family 4 protein [Micromonospora endophytica]|uniref:Glycosyltransferase family 1 protein n=1 Tax=Micromonospora endophytica TaxID=515350 RepID=A0A2W2C7W7_9ACTN|nr:glycosyltransferase family 4 protein [Micromonospora endophytica]PZF88874.1 glycosyltransferase family 1 protein [Micromonospora endophytica]RIW40467.1 glycosyltransferase family 1 protein [Micromonospora endophytica]BCJ61485.1 glycogen synthase [Micromonospora endophytica]